jgi:sarcosine oxidase
MYDTIVIGLGGMGSATACHLARRGQKVLGLEQHAIGHAMGSSHGQTRIIRKAYFEHPDYVPLLQTAYRHWNELAAQTNEEIIKLCGLILAGRDDDTIVAGTRRAARLSTDSPLEEVAPATLRDATLGPATPEEHGRTARSGWRLSPRGALRPGTPGPGPQRRGGTARRRASPFLGGQGGMVEVLTRRATYQGQESRALRRALDRAPLAGVEALPLTTHRVVTAWFPSNNPAHHAGKGAPVFALQTPDGFFYGFPQLDQRGVKIAEHRPGTLLAHPGDIDRVVAKEDVRRIQAFAQGLSEEPAYRLVDGRNVHLYDVAGWRLHRRSASQTQECIPGRGVQRTRLQIRSAIGAIMADFCEHGRTEHPVAFLGLSRFA